MTPNAPRCAPGPSSSSVCSAGPVAVGPVAAAGITAIDEPLVVRARTGVKIGEAREVKAALVIDAGHRLPADGLWRERPDLPRAGDAVAPRTIYEAVLEGRRAALAVDNLTR